MKRFYLFLLTMMVSLASFAQGTKPIVLDVVDPDVSDSEIWSIYENENYKLHIDIIYNLPLDPARTYTLEDMDEDYSYIYDKNEIVEGAFGRKNWKRYEFTSISLKVGENNELEAVLEAKNGEDVISGTFVFDNPDPITVTLEGEAEYIADIPAYAISAKNAGSALKADYSVQFGIKGDAYESKTSFTIDDLMANGNSIRVATVETKITAATINLTVDGDSQTFEGTVVGADGKNYAINVTTNVPSKEAPAPEPLKVSIVTWGSQLYVEFPYGIKLEDNMTEMPYIIAGGNKIEAESYFIDEDVSFFIGMEFDEVFADGDYTLVLPAGMFSVNGGDDNGEWSYAFTEGNPSVTLNDAGFATFSYITGTIIKTAGVTAYTAVVDGEDIVLTELDGNIPANTGVILYGTPGTKVELGPTWNDFANVTENDLKPTVLEGCILAPFEANAWALGNANEFLTYTGTAFIPNRAYIASAGTSSAKRIVFADKETTAINNAISNAAVREGKFVEDGKIVIIKNGAKYNVAGQEVK